MDTCTTCGAAGQPETARFCFSCGGPLGVPVCASCSAELVPGASFCGSCGAPQGTLAPAGPLVTAPVTAPVSARRVTSVLFGDLVSFTTYSESRDQEEVRELLSRYFQECQQVIGRYGGTVEKFIGDAVMAVWGVPTAHEDDAERAVRAGLELVAAVDALGADLGIAGLAMRVGIVTGEVAVTIGAQQQGMVAGDAVNTASRVQSVAESGQVWVDETTRLLTTSAITYVDVGAHLLKGKADPVPLWAVRAVVAKIGGNQRADGLEAPCVGRDRELRLVKELFHSVEESGRPALLIIDGEPGVGKTRLSWELYKYVDGLSGKVRWHNGRCLAYGEGVAFFALAEAIRGRLQHEYDGDDIDDPRVLLLNGLDRFVADPDERSWLEPRLGVLLGTGSGGTFPREDLFSAWTTFLHRVGADEPVTLMIDDAQHADDGLIAYLEHLLAVGTFPCFITLLTRPGLLERHPGLATNRRATVLHLDTLSDADVGTLLDGLVAGIPAGVRESLVRRAEGVPLFAVETVRSLIDRDLVIPRGGQYVLADAEALDLASIGAPASLQALLTARLDTLSPAQRQVVNQASVVGTSFAQATLARLCGSMDDLGEVLESLVRIQLFRQESDRFSSERGQFQFVQSAMRQVAYGSLARRDRKASHLAVAGELEEQDDADGIAAVIAQHYLEAIDAVPDAPDSDQLTSQAISWLRRAAARAAALGSPAEASGHLLTALARVGDPQVHSMMEIELARALVQAGRYEEAVTHAEVAVAAMKESDDTLDVASATVTLALAHAALGDNEGAVRLLQPHYETLRTRPEAALVVLELARAMTRAMLRLNLDFRLVAEDGLRLAELVGDEQAIADSYIGLSLHYSNNGVMGLSRMLLESAAALARKNHDILALTRALVNLNAVWNQDDAELAVRFGREALETARSTAYQTWISAAASNLQIAGWEAGDWDEALTLEGIEDLDHSDQFVVESVRALIAQARGEEWTPPNVEIVPSDDGGGLAWEATLRALAATRAGDRSAALEAAREAAEGYYAFGALTDDFTIIWQVAVGIALQHEDDQLLERLVTLVMNHVESNPSRGLRGELARARALLAIRSADPEIDVEAELRAAIHDFEQWHAAPSLALARRDLGLWLVDQGRAEEGEALLAEARVTLDRLGARAWLATIPDAVPVTR
jgi:class 3 adenylate cyclase/tetratricopeptide (TPR) repeat protein